MKGDVYYAMPTGSEKGFPVILLTEHPGATNRMNVVRVTRNPKVKSEYDVWVCATGEPAVARCDTLTEVPCTWLSHYVGRCTDEEMTEIRRAIGVRLGINYNA